MLKDVLPFPDVTSKSALVQGIGMECLEVPVHTVWLESALVTGPVKVGIRTCFPIEGVAFTLGNDLAGGMVLIKPEVTAVPLCSTRPDVLPQ